MKNSPKAITHFVELEFSCLDLISHRYQLLPETELHIAAPTRLAEIKRFGILQPPLIRQTEQGQYPVVTGWHDIIAFHHIAPADPIPCLLIPCAVSEEDTFSLILHHAQQHGRLSPIEEAYFLQKIISIFPKASHFTWLKKLGYPTHQPALESILSRLQLSQAVIKALHISEISIKIAKQMAKFDTADQAILIKLIHYFQLGGSKQRQLIEMSLELQKRQNRSLTDIFLPLSLEPLTGKNTETGINAISIKTPTALLSWLQQACRPQLNTAENQFQKWVAQFELPKGITLTHSPAFEKDTINLDLAFHKKERLEQAWPKLLEIYGNKGK